MPRVRHPAPAPPQEPQEPQEQQEQQLLAAPRLVAVITAVVVAVVAAVIALVPPGRRRLWWSVAAVAFSVLMAASRAYLAAHWLSDAIAGILLGTSCALLAALAADQLQRRQHGTGERRYRA